MLLISFKGRLEEFHFENQLERIVSKTYLISWNALIDINYAKEDLA